MYQVLLVDDEPLILSGIKFMIDWQKNDCQIADTARNGQQALGDEDAKEYLRLTKKVAEYMKQQ